MEGICAGAWIGKTEGYGPNAGKLIGINMHGCGGSLEPISMLYHSMTTSA